MRYSGVVAALAVLGCSCVIGSAQQTPAAQPTPSPAEKKPVIETPSMRLASARSVIIVRAAGSEIPVETIRSNLATGCSHNNDAACRSQTHGRCLNDRLLFRGRRCRLRGGCLLRAADHTTAT